MNPQLSAPPPGWVTVAQAAAVLTKDGDTIDASNVSRYLARWADIPQQRIGKFRYVDPIALARHRKQNVLVVDKTASRDVAPPPAESAPLLERRAEPELASSEDASPPSPLQEANLRLRNLQIRERELDLAEREGRLVPDVDVIALLAAVTQALVSEMERQELAIVATYGREVGAAFRRARKSAQAHAAARLADLARKHLPAPLAAVALDAATAPAEPETGIAA